MKEERVETRTLSVAGMHCGHCEAAVARELERVDGVAAVTVNLEAKAVIVRGDRLEDDVLIAAIEVAGYEAHTVAV